ncbi:hypothetical protein KUCAC02_014641, partial [Chaenocephalus aceratus]
TLKSTTLALCYSAAEYACPVWERAAHAKKLDPTLNASCRIITGCLKSTPTYRLYILAGIAPPEIRRNAASKKEPTTMELKASEALPPGADTNYA